MGKFTLQTRRPGCYFGLSHKEYLEDQALSYSGIKLLRQSPMDFWVHSWINPKRDPISVGSSSMAMGTELHKRILEGAAAFNRAYAITPGKEAHPDALACGDDYRAMCKRLGLKVSGTNTELIQRIKDVDPDVVIWSEVVEQFHTDCNARGVIPISSETATQVEEIATIVENAVGQAFQGGYPEVSVFWVDELTGVPMKARLDYLKVNTLIDLKSFANIKGLPVAKAVAQAVINRCYHAQAALYLEAVNWAKTFFEKGMVFVRDGQGPDEPWSKAFMEAPPVPRFFWVFIETGDAHNVLVREFRPMVSEGIPSLLGGAGDRIIRRGIDAFAACLNEFGTDRPWMAAKAEILPFEDHHFPIFALEEE